MTVPSPAQQHRQPQGNNTPSPRMAHARPPPPAASASVAAAAAAAAGGYPFPSSAHFRHTKTSFSSHAGSPGPASPSLNGPTSMSAAAEGSAVPSYLRELAQAEVQKKQRWMLSREPSLPSLMSMPKTRPTSPSAHDLGLPPTSPRSHRPGSHAGSAGHTRRGSTSAGAGGLGLHLSTGSVTGRGRAAGAAAVPGSLRAFEEGVGHYERVRSPSLRGHSRRGSWSGDPSLLGGSIASLRNGTTSAGPVASSGMDRGPSGANDQQWWLSEEDEDYLREIGEEDWLGDETVRDVGPAELGAAVPGLGDEGEEGWSREEVGVWEVGERLGIGTVHQGSVVKDLFGGSGEAGAAGDTPSGMNVGGLGKKPAPLLEVVRQIGVGSYAVVYLVREVLYDPHLDRWAPPSTTEASSSIFPSRSPSEGACSITPKASAGFMGPQAAFHGTRGPKEALPGEGGEVVYGRDFALKCLCKKDLSEELLVLQRGEAELHRALPAHPNIVALHSALETPAWLFLVIDYCPGQDLFYWLEQARDSQDLDSFASRTNSFSTQLVPPLYVATNYRVPDQHTPPEPSLLASTADDEMLSRRRLRLISRMFAQMCDAVQACHEVGVCHRDIKPENFIVVDDRKTGGAASESNEQQPNASSQTPVTVKITDWGLGTSSPACDDFDCGSKPYMAFECRNNLHPTYDPVQADVWSLGIVLLNLLYHRCPWADPVLTDADFATFREAPVAFLLDRFEGMTSHVAIYLATKIFCEVHPGATNERHRVSAGEFGAWVRHLVNHMGGGQNQASASDATIPMSPSSARGSSSPARMAASIELGNSTGSKPTSQLVHSIRVPAAPLPPVIDDAPPATSPPPTTRTVEPCEQPSPPALAVGDLPLPPPPARTMTITTTTTTATNGEEAGGPHSPGADGPDLASSEAGTSDRQRRRKRGARKGRKDGHRSGAETAPASPVMMPADVNRDEILSDLAEASQSLVRELSQVQKPGSGSSPEGKQPKAKPGVGFKGRFLNSTNADFNAFAARAKARDNALYGGDTASAPAKLQRQQLGSNVSHATSASSGMHSAISSFGTSSWGSQPVKEEAPRGRAGDRSPWASAAHRRERLSTSRTTGPPGGHEARVGSRPREVMGNHKGTSPLTGHSNAASSEASWRPPPPPGWTPQNRSGLEPIVEKKTALYHSKDASTSTSSLNKTIHATPRPPPAPATAHLPSPPPPAPVPTANTRAGGKGEGKTKLASLLMSFKRFNQGISSAGSGIR